jgi:hypothetical protein
MEKKYKPKVWDEFTIVILILCGALVMSDILLWVQGSSWAVILVAIFLELALLVVFFLVRLLIQSQQAILDEQSITHVCRSGLLFKFHKRTVNWKDVTRIEGEFGFIHIGERITLYIGRNKFSTYDIIQERDRITITNVLRDFEDLVCEIVKRGSNATVSESVKHFVSRHGNTKS